jgi:phosphotransacetylase
VRERPARRRYFPYSELQQNANVLAFPDLQALQHENGSAEDLVNVAAMGVVQAAETRRLAEEGPRAS